MIGHFAEPVHIDPMPTQEQRAVWSWQVREIRRSLGLSRSKLARRFGATRVLLQSWEYQGAMPKPEPLQRFAAVTGADLRALLTIVGEEG